MQRATKREGKDRAIQIDSLRKYQTLIKLESLKPLLGTEHLFTVEALSLHKSSLTFRKKRGEILRGKI